MTEPHFRSEDLDEPGEAKEAFSDLEIGDSDEEILNKINPNENDEDGQLQVSEEESFGLFF